MLLKLDVSAFHLLSKHVHSREISELTVDNEWIGLFVYEKTHGISTSIGPGWFFDTLVRCFNPHGANALQKERSEG